jgi:hypothetical protein
MADFIEGSIILQVNGSDFELKGKLVKGQVPSAASLPTKLPEIAVGYSQPIGSALSLGSLNSNTATGGAVKDLLDQLGVTELGVDEVVTTINQLPVVGTAIANADIRITDLVIDTRNGQRNFLFGFGVLFNGGTSIATVLTVKALGVRIAKGNINLSGLRDEGIIN